MESISDLLSSRTTLFLRNSSRLFVLDHSRDSIRFGQTRHYVKDRSLPRLRLLGTYSLRADGASQIDHTKDYAPQSITVSREDEDERIKTLIMQIKHILRSMKDGEISPSAYDTAWVARVPSKDDPTKPQFPTTLDWILENQHEDGSWGESSFFLIYDRLVCTLACILALKTWSTGEHHIANGTYSLRADGASQIDHTKDYAPQSITVSREDEDDRIKTLIMQIKHILRSMKDGETSPSAYDTAWVARVPSKDDPTKQQFPSTLDWILENQHEDGSWGESSFFLIYDRLVCTLACILALKTWSTGEQHIANGLKFLRAHVEEHWKETTGSRTSGFEIIFPSMLNEAKSIGLELPYDSHCLEEVFALREKKMLRIPMEMLHTVRTTLLYSIEALQDVVQWDRILKLQSRDGSFLSSPSATAAAYMRTGDTKCLEFLTSIIKIFGDHVPCQYPFDLLERIWAVDTIQRLGIDHHFREEISDILDYVCRNIGKQGVSWGRDSPIPDIDDTCMALRLMRLHGYPISLDVLKHFKDNNGDFVCFPGETHRGVSDMFNLYRFSQISFPGEKILKEAKSFVEEYLQNCIKNNQMGDKWSLRKSLHKEVEYALRYPWKISLQRVEVREYINQYAENDVWIAKTVYWMYNVNNPKYLELAKLEHNRLQAMYKREINSILKWWNLKGLVDPSLTHISPKETYFSIAATLYEPEFKDCRIAYTKSNCIEDILKDFFHDHELIGDLELFCQAVQKWRPSLIHSLPPEVKAIFMAMYDTYNELAIQASNVQGKDVFPYIHDLILEQIQSYLNNRVIREGKHFASWKEYIENGKKDCGVAIRTVPAMFLMGEHMKDHVLRRLDNRSRINDQLSMYLRLLIDVRTYENVKDKETTAAICSYMNEEQCTEEEALNDLKEMAEDAFHELVHEYLKPSQVPRCCRRLMFEHGRITHFFLGDGINSHLTQRERINDAMESFYSLI